MKRKTVSLGLSLTMLALFAPFAWSSDSLNFFNNWFVTGGDYAVAGVGLRGTGAGANGGWATGKINMTGLPNGAEPIAAFLYWSSVETSSTPSASIGYFNTNKIQGAVMGNPQSPNPACSSSGGGTSGYGFVYRADVLRYLPVDSNNIPQAAGKQTVKLPDSTGTVLYTNGASLIVIYKVIQRGLSFIAPLRAVVIYNGAYTMNKNSAGMTQTVAGFYQASTDADARITGIVANGQPGFSSPLSVNGNTLDTDPFVGAQGVRWDNPTYNINLAANASSFSALATVGTNQTCLTFAAIVASVAVQDSDGDGLLDLWETKGLHRNTQVSPATFGTCSDYPAEPCVNLPAMGANPNKQDIFVQIDWMHGTGDGTGGTDGHGTHDHMPQLAALSSVAATFALHRISLHFDVGGSSNYQGVQAICGRALCPFIVPAAYAQGGTDIPESTLLCQDTKTHSCDYHEPYPVLSFEFGFASVRDGNKSAGISQHFAQNRKDAFHYALFAHALAGPFNAAGQPVNPFTGAPTTTPLSYSGIAHRPGGGFMVTLGLWRSDIPANDQVGSFQVQEGTLMHELGHNLGLGHAGLATKPNCMPNYPSVMNYLYQTRGLTDASGNEQVDYSYGWLLPLSEDFLSATIPIAFPGVQHYRVRYYGPLAPNQPATQGAQVHCDGTPLAGEAPEVRLEGPAVSTPDWSNGTVPLGHLIPALDVNYDGTLGQTFWDSPDWFTLNLQQIGTGYSFGGLSVGAFATDGGAYATDGGAFATDAGALATDGGAFATDGGAFATDGGAFATDGGAFATDGGAFATDGGAFATDAGELDEITVLLSSVDSPPTPTATNTNSSIVVNWLPPGVGTIASYNVYRCAGAACTPSAPAFKNVTGGTATPSFTDVVNDFADAGATCPAASTCYNTTYVYAVTSLVLVNSSQVESLLSKTASSEVTHLFVLGVVPPPATGAVPGPSQTYIYGATIPSPTYAVYGDVASNLTSGVTCAYSPANPRNVGVYQIVCSGPSPTLTPTSGTDGVTYNAKYLSYISGVLTIVPRPITVTAVASSKTYDGTTNAQTGIVPTITTSFAPLPALVNGDTSGFSETYDNRNVGTTHVMTPSGAVNDQNGGLNYAVTFVKSPATSVINALPITVTPAASIKTYDGTTNPQTGIIPTIAPNLGAGDTASFTETYSTRNVGASLLMTTAGTVLDGNNGNNYVITLATANVGTINKLAITVTPAASSKPYDGTTSPQPGIIPAIAPPLATGDTASFTEAYSSRSAGANLQMNTAGTVNDGNNGNNYAITLSTANVGTISKLGITVTPAASTKTYDGTTSPQQGIIPTIAPPLVSGDNPSFTEAYASKNAGANLQMNTAGTVNDGNNGNNYAITLSTANVGTINKLGITVTPAASSKPYDGTTAPQQGIIPTIAPSLGAGDGASFTEAYSSSSVGSGLLMTTAGTVLDGNSGNNYTITLATANVGTISQATASVTPNANGKIYGTLDPPLTGTLTGFLPGDGVTATYTRTQGEAVGTYTISAVLASSTGALGNYNITSNTALFTISRAPASVTPNASGKPYGTPDPSPVTTGTLTGFLQQDNVTATYTRAAGNDAGMYAITATLAPTGVLTNYNITYNPAVFTILPAPQSITFAQLSDQPFGIPDFQVNATASSGLTVSFTASGNCSVTTGGLVHLIATGNCTITASQAGGGNYLPAISVNQSFMITGGIDFTTLSLVGYPTNPVATATPTTLTMTSGTGQTSAAWLPVVQRVGSGFTTQFTFQITPGATDTIADGFAFVIQNGPAGTSALGTTGMGGYLGYQGLPTSLAIEFDTYQDGWDPNGNHVAIQSNGTGLNSADHTTLAPLAINAGIATTLSDGNVHTVIVNYDGSTLTVSLDGTQVLSVPVDLSALLTLNAGRAVIGFTAATGSDNEVTQISGWSFAAN